MKSTSSSVKLTLERTLTVRRPKFQLFENTKYLDIDKLSRGKHTIELGKFEGCACDCSISATVKDGVVTAINYPKCESGTPMPAKFEKQLAAARRKLGGSTKWEDFPVADLTKSSAARSRIVVVVVTSGDCYEVCIDPGTGKQTCWICCPGWCIGPSDPRLAIY